MGNKAFRNCIPCASLKVDSKTEDKDISDKACQIRSGEETKYYVTVDKTGRMLTMKTITDRNDDNQWFSLTMRRCKKIKLGQLYFLLFKSRIMNKVVTAKMIGKEPSLVLEDERCCTRNEPRKKECFNSPMIFKTTKQGDGFNVFESTAFEGYFWNWDHNTSSPVKLRKEPYPFEVIPPLNRLMTPSST